MKILKKTSILLVLLAVLLTAAGLRPADVSADTQIDKVEILMNSLAFYFTPVYTEGTVAAAVAGQVSFKADSKCTLDELNTGLSKKIGASYRSIWSGNSHMSPAHDYYYLLCVRPLPGYEFTSSTTATVNDVEAEVVYLSSDTGIYIYAKAPGVGLGNYTLYTIEYDANGGSGDHPDDMALKDVPMTLSRERFSPPAGHEFQSWAIGSPEGIIAHVGDGVIFTEDTRVYAIWRPLGTEETDPTTAVTTASSAVSTTSGELTESTGRTEETSTATTLETTLTSSSDKRDDIPLTGENQSMMIGGILLFVFGAGLFTLSLYIKKGRKKEY